MSYCPKVAIGPTRVIGAFVQAVVALLVIRSGAKCVLIQYLPTKVHTVLVHHSISDLVYQEQPALEHQLTEDGHHGLNGHNALILMVIGPE
uniref:Uncharacterized protein n=1 Tax=Brugia malayi TaxID=6279 RepID=A8PPN2_BRUMA